ncbi:MAG: trigger factor [Thermoleophilaceae bacterium]
MAVKTTTTELERSRVRVDVEVEPASVEKELTATAKELASEMKMPGFRKGKVPAEVVMRQLGRETVLDQALRRALPSWYEEAVTDAGVTTVGDPKLDLADLPKHGDPLAFSIEVGVRPKAKLGEYKGVEAGRREATATDEEIDGELEAQRDALASLENVDRPAGKDDFVVVDFVGKVDGEPFDGGDARGYLLELGSGRLIPGFEEQLEGASAGETCEVKVSFPDDYGAEHLAGKEAVFETDVKEIKEKKLPELDDDFAADAGGFDSLAEMREEIGSKIAEVKGEQLEGEFRENVVDAAAANATIDIPAELIEAKAAEMWNQAARGLARRGIPPDQYIQMTGRTQEQLVEDAKPDAEKALRREAVLAAVIDEEGIEVSDDELLDALRTAATAADGSQPTDEDLKKTLDRAREQGRDELLREDIAMRKAVDVLAEHAKPIPIEQQEARDKLWTPEKEAAEKKSKLWTPGS